jgi:integrase
MSSKPRIPSYRRHKQSGQAVVTITDAVTGRRRDVLLGRYGSKASKEDYKRIVLDLEANERRLPGAAPEADLTVEELVSRYLRHVEAYYRHDDGTPTGEVQAMRYALRPLHYLHAKTQVRDFGPSSLKAVRELMVKGYEHPKFGVQPPICRTRINAQVKRIRRMFKWGVENELVPPAVLQGLQAVAPLKRGRSEAKESQPVKPVARAVVNDTLDILRPVLADMVSLQLESGMRPGELVVMRACDIDMSGPVWVYRPGSDRGPAGQHKTAHHGHERVVPIGPKGQAVIRRHLTASVEAYLFSPRKLMEERVATMRTKRKTKVQPSQRDRRKRNPRKSPGDRYTSTSHAQALRKAIERHNKGKAEAAQIPHWHPHQLRHLRALELKREVGLDVARAVLGHRSPAITEMYATIDIAKGAEAMGRLG